MHSPISRRLGSCLLVLAPLAAGCVPESLSWLPDSSALIFTEMNSKRLVRYDLKTKKKRTLVEDTETMTVGPAVSPDGKQIVVARWQREEDKPSKLQVIVYSITGKEEWRSHDYEWSHSHKAKGLGATSVFPVGKNHFVVIAEDIQSPASGAALVNRKTDHLIRLKGLYPLLHRRGIARPDGKGFLACRNVPDQDGIQLLFVDLEGKVKPFSGGLLEEKEAPAGGFDLRWEKDTAILSGSGVVLRADTRTGKLTRSKSKAIRPALLPTEDKLLLTHWFPKTRAALCFYEEKELRKGKKDKLSKIEWHDLTTKKRKVLVDRCQGFNGAYPSPDGKLAAFWYTTDGKTSKIAIFDSAGKKVADFETAP